ncbi:transmembrane protein [Thraustotheca clavata]|uniref:50S ribosomal protein L9, chloroplastic n=1 Tax=Thraustotheca clavata TaxID=74557 RepID=A0A1W0A8X4_9STRA|nr:transmembrane protein [Thraustotheca clavata]
MIVRPALHRFLPRSLAVRSFANRVDMVLKQDVPKLGFIGEVVNVKAGYARNYLYPEKKAVYATKVNLNKYAQDKKVDESVDSEREHVRGQIIKRLTSIELTFKRHCPTSKPATKSSVTAQNIVDMLEKQHGIIVGIARVVLPQELKSIGNHNVKIRVDDGIDEEVAAIKAKTDKEVKAVNPDAPQSNTTQTVLAQFESERFDTKKSTSDASEAEEIVSSIPKRTVNLKVVINRR